MFGVFVDWSAFQNQTDLSVHRTSDSLTHLPSFFYSNSSFKFKVKFSKRIKTKTNVFDVHFTLIGIVSK